MDSSVVADRPMATGRAPALRRWLGPLLLSIGLLALPMLVDNFVAYQIALFLLYGIATQGVALCWGQCGFLPLGHALFFGLGAYLAGCRSPDGAYDFQHEAHLITWQQP